MQFKNGNKLYKKAKKLIPGGTQLLSKRPEMFLPGGWPAYYKKCKGAEVWDLDNNKFIDMSISGVGACVLGYSDPDVDKAVKDVIDKGSMCTLNCPEEVELAELLCELHPWAKMAKYARCGGEAMAIAVRIARAATGRDKIAFCGYHGWHDWYLSANLNNDKNLDGHLLPGLHPAGVPRGLINTAIPFNYNNIRELEEITGENKNLAAIIMEPLRNKTPDEGFLEKVRKIANSIGAVLIFDEITSGWRLNTGGVHLLYKINPDIAVFAKAMGNGYPMAAIIGRSAVMESAQDSFISSTYWTERIGPAAALATIKKHRNKHVSSHLKKIGEMVQNGWDDIAKSHNLTVEISGMAPLGHFNFDLGEQNQIYNSFFTKEMLKRGFLACSSFYASYAHKEEHVQKYLSAVDEIFSIISSAVKNNNIKTKFKGIPAHTGFKRLT